MAYLSTFSAVELIFYAAVWCVLGGLAGFYLFTALGRNPRRGALFGVLTGVAVGMGALLVGIGFEPITDEGVVIGYDGSVQSLFAVVMGMWGTTLLLSVLLQGVPGARGNHHLDVNIRQATADLAYGLLMPTFLIVFTIVVFPMIWNVVLAFRPVRTMDLANLRIFSLEGLTLDNFNRVFRGSERFFEDFWPALAYTIMYLGVLILGWLSGGWAAERFQRDRRNGQWLGFASAFVVVVLLILWQQYLASIGVLLGGRAFLNTLMRTIVYTIGGSLLAIFMGLVAALIVKDSFPGRNVVRGFMLFPYIAPIVSTVFIWTMLLNAQFGLINEWIDGAGGQRIDFLTTPGWAFSMIILFQGWRYFPFAFLFILARIQAIPDDIYEAAKVDGAAPSERLLYITLPQLRAVFATLFLLRFIWTFNKFDDVFLLTGGAANTQLVTIEVYDQLFSRSNIGAASAVAMVLAVVLFIFVGVYFKWFYAEEN